MLLLLVLVPNFRRLMLLVMVRLIDMATRDIVDIVFIFRQKWMVVYFGHLLWHRHFFITFLYSSLIALTLRWSLLISSLLFTTSSWDTTSCHILSLTIIFKVVVNLFWITWWLSRTIHSLRLLLLYLVSLYFRFILVSMWGGWTSGSRLLILLLHL